MTIYEIDAAILDCIDMETGEVIDIDRLNALEMERDQKVSNVACWVKDLKAEAEAIKAEKQSLDKRQRAAENKAEQLKNYLTYVLNGTKYKDARVSISYRRSESVQCSDDAINTLPDEFIKVEKSVKKTELKEAMKNGQTFEGCEIVTKDSIQIR
jgi:hypothetical protein